MTEPGERSLSELLGRIGLKHRAQGDAAVRAMGLSALQGQTIGYLHVAEQEGQEVIQRTIAERAGMRAGSVTSLLQGLEHDGYIERRSDPSDERRKTLHTTAKGREVIVGFHAAMAEYERSLVAPLSADELATLVGLLDRIDAGLA